MAPKKKTPVFARRAWNLLRLALLWARKGGVFKRDLMVDLRLLPGYIKSLRHSHHGHDSIKYQEREFSFDETPLFHFKFHRRGTGASKSMRFLMPGFPCIKRQVDFDFDFELEGEELEREDDNGRNSFLNYEEEEEEEEEETEDQVDNGRKSFLKYKEEEGEEEEEEAIDRKAEEFIARFYEQMKLQRQVSYLQYTKMLDRGTS